MKIYQSLKEAVQACETYDKELIALQKRLGVWEECDDSCAIMFIKTRYLDETGGIKTYCHD